jgi:hypothetical protein
MTNKIIEPITIKCARVYFRENIEGNVFVEAAITARGCKKLIPRKLQRTIVDLKPSSRSNLIKQIKKLF